MLAGHRHIPFTTWTQSLVVVLLITMAAVVHADSTQEGTQTTVTVTGGPAAPNHRDGYYLLLVEEAQDALHAGRFKAARQMFESIVERYPKDPYPHRELGRTCMALTDHATAVRVLRKAHALQGWSPDPELHYLLGESLYAMKDVKQARAAHAQALRELDPNTTDRMQLLWLGRIHARLGDRNKSDHYYTQVAARVGGVDPEIALNHAEAFLLRAPRDWKSAERILRKLLQARPRNQRAREMLAWVLEGLGKYDTETKLRNNLAGWTGGFNWLHYGRSLERNGDYKAALRAYRQAARMQGKHSELGLGTAIDRMRYRLTTEVAAGAQFRSDPTGVAYEWHVGVSQPIDSGLHLSLITAFETASDGPLRDAGSRLEATAGLRVRLWKGAESVVSVSGGQTTVLTEAAGGMTTSRQETKLGTSAELTTALGRWGQLDARADLRTQWTESAYTVRAGGFYNGLQSFLHLKPFSDKVIFEVGGQSRWFDISPLSSDEDNPSAHQLLLVGGVDVVAWAAPTSAVRGEILNRTLTKPSYMASSVVFGHRHYEAFSDTDAMFAARVPLVRASIDEISVTGRKVFGNSVGFEGRGGVGRDWARNLNLWRLGASLEVASTQATRFSLTYDVATETGTGLVGRRHAGWLNFHVDL